MVVVAVPVFFGAKIARNATEAFTNYLFRYAVHRHIIIKYLSTMFKRAREDSDICELQDVQKDCGQPGLEEVLTTSRDDMLFLCLGQTNVEKIKGNKYGIFVWIYTPPDIVDNVGYRMLLGTSSEKKNAVKASEFSKKALAFQKMWEYGWHPDPQYDGEMWDVSDEVERHIYAFTATGPLHARNE